MDITPVPAGVALDVGTDAAGKPVAVYKNEDGTEWKPPSTTAAPTAQSEVKREPEASADSAEGDGEPYHLDSAGFQSMSQEFLAAEVEGVDYAKKEGLIEFVSRCLSSGSTYSEAMIREHLEDSRVGFGFSPEVSAGLIEKWYSMVEKTSGPKTTALSKDAARVALKKLRAPGSPYWDTRSPLNQNARAEVSRLYNIIHDE